MANGGATPSWSCIELIYECAHAPGRSFCYCNVIIFIKKYQTTSTNPRLLTTCITFCATSYGLCTTSPTSSYNVSQTSVNTERNWQPSFTVLKHWTKFADTDGITKATENPTTRSRACSSHHCLSKQSFRTCGPRAVCSLRWIPLHRDRAQRRPDHQTGMQ